MGVGHVEDLVSEDGVEDCLGLGVRRQDLLVEREPTGGGLLREMEEGEQRGIVLAGYMKLIETAFSGSEPVGLEARLGSWGKAPDESAPALAEEIGVPVLIRGMAQVQPPQQRIAGELGRAAQISTPIGLGLGEAEKLARPAARAVPDPAVNGA
jgi:hypothetical protein